MSSEMIAAFVLLGIVIAVGVLMWWASTPHTPSVRVRPAPKLPELDPLGEYVFCPHCELLGRHYLEIKTWEPRRTPDGDEIIVWGYIGQSRYWQRTCMFDSDHTWTGPYREDSSC